VADGEHVILRNNVASNCGVQGMGSGGTSHLLFENNLLDDNNYKGVSPWSEGGAIKTGFWGTHIVIRGNVARNNHNHGLWIDYGGPDCVIENNFVFNAVAGAILNEVTPNPEQSQFPDGTLCGEKEPKADAVRRFQQRGTIIRNNVLVGTRAPGGGGINISSSSDGRIYNNIVAANVGGGLNYGGSFDRPHTAGQARNRCWANLAFDNAHHATVLRQEDDRHERTFGNVMEGNLFVAARGERRCGLAARAPQPASSRRTTRAPRTFTRAARSFATRSTSTSRSRSPNWPPGWASNPTSSGSIGASSTCAPPTRKARACARGSNSCRSTWRRRSTAA
jgi:hypothetical protein